MSPIETQQNYMSWLRHLVNLLTDIRVQHTIKSIEPPRITDLVVTSLNHMVDTIIQNLIDFTSPANTTMAIMPTQMLLILMISIHGPAALIPLQRRRMVKIFLR